MFNILITAKPEAWENELYEIDKDRFLEYTISFIKEKYKGLTEENIEDLKNFPCLFAYEGREKEYRFGHIMDIKDRDNRVFIKYKIDDRVDPIPFELIERNSMLLDLRDWEFNRTHWAVKDGDLFDIFKDEGIELNVDGEKLSSTAIDDFASVGKIQTVKDFIDIIFRRKENLGFEVFYRGHSNDNYKLEPSLFRTSNSVKQYEEIEDILFKELLVSNSSDFLMDSYTIDKLVRMQHYSLPTRLLDITSNPLIALYFACKEDFINDGEVIVFSVKKDKIKYYDSDTASCISNLALLPSRDKNAINYQMKKFNAQEPILKLIHLIREEKPYFVEKIKPEDLQSILCLKSKMTNSRIVSQSGAFLLFGHNAIMNEKGTDNIIVDRIKVSSKDNILHELDLLNINDRTVFPYIENSAKYLANKYSIKSL